MGQELDEGAAQALAAALAIIMGLARTLSLGRQLALLHLLLMPLLVPLLPVTMQLRLRQLLLLWSLGLLPLTLQQPEQMQRLPVPPWLELEPEPRRPSLCHLSLACYLLLVMARMMALEPKMAVTEPEMMAVELRMLALVPMATALTKGMEPAMVMAQIVAMSLTMAMVEVPASGKCAYC